MWKKGAVFDEYGGGKPGLALHAGPPGALLFCTPSSVSAFPPLLPAFPPCPPALPCQALAAEELSNAALALSHYQSQIDADEVDLDLMEMLLMYICEVRKATHRQAVQWRYSSSSGTAAAHWEAVQQRYSNGALGGLFTQYSCQQY